MSRSHSDNEPLGKIPIHSPHHWRLLLVPLVVPLGHSEHANVEVSSARVTIRPQITEMYHLARLSIPNYFVKTFCLWFREAFNQGNRWIWPLQLISLVTQLSKKLTFQTPFLALLWPQTCCVAKWQHLVQLTIPISDKSFWAWFTMSLWWLYFRELTITHSPVVGN